MAARGRMVRKTVRRRKPFNPKSRRGATRRHTYRGGKLVAGFRHFFFPRGVASARGSLWAKPRNR